MRNNLQFLYSIITYVNVCIPFTDLRKYTIKFQLIQITHFIKYFWKLHNYIVYISDRHVYTTNKQISVYLLALQVVAMKMCKFV